MSAKRWLGFVNMFGGQNLVIVLHTRVSIMLKSIRTRIRTESISEKLFWNTQFGYPNIAFNLNT